MNKCQSCGEEISYGSYCNRHRDDSDFTRYDTQSSSSSSSNSNSSCNDSSSYSSSCSE